MNSKLFEKYSINIPEMNEADFQTLVDEAKSAKTCDDICKVYKYVRPILEVLKHFARKPIEILMAALDAYCANCGAGNK